MTYTGAGGFTAFSTENAKILGVVPVHNEIVLGNNLLQGYDCEFFKNFAARFRLRISLKVKRFAYTQLISSPP